MTFIAGPYTATYAAALGGAGAQTLGIVEDGFDLEEIHYAEAVRGDNLGDTVQDYVNRGKDVFINAVFEECDLAAVARAMFPGANLNAPNFLNYQGSVPQVGTLHTNLAGALVLTAVAGTTAVASPATLTALKAVIAPNYAMRRAMASRLRKIPMRFQLLPYVVSTITYHYQMA